MKTCNTLLICLALGLALSACGKRSESFEQSPSPSQQDKSSVADPSAMTRSLAVSHSLELETADQASKKQAWTQLQQQCQMPGCYIISASFSNRASSSAELKVSVAKPALATWMNSLARFGEITEHQLQLQDQTDSLADLGSQIKTLTDIRDRLRKRLDEPGLESSELLAVAQHLTEIQLKLDQLTASKNTTRQLVVRDTITMQLRAKTGAYSASTWESVTDAARSGTRLFADSLAAAIQFLIVVTPWVLLFIPLLYLLTCLRNWRRKRKQVPALPPATKP
ncbi:DUF4349 domain-containing protein [Neisseriaceae bacterium TC5R-5]|nr:DUF4349 domain-containing protein [Neisseriaceae bacterium TC5R-5]